MNPRRTLTEWSDILLVIISAVLAVMATAFVVWLLAVGAR